MEAEVDETPLAEEWLTIIVKARIRTNEPSILLRPDMFFGRPAQAAPFQRPVDFVPMKDCVDLLIVGHLTLPTPDGRAPRPQLSGSFAAGEDSTALEFVSHGAARIPLTLEHARVRGESGEDGALYPVNLHDGAEDDFEHQLGFPWGLYQAASRPHLLRENVKEGSTISLRLEGQQTPAFEFTMPSVSPCVVVDFAIAGAAKKRLRGSLETVLIDLDKQEVELTWRAYLRAINGVKDLERLLIGWASVEALEDGSGWKQIERNLPLGTFHHAWTFADADRGVPPPALSAQEEEIARYQTWGYPLAPEPSLPLETFAEVTVEIAERREPRSTILARHGLNEQKFALEERGWLERVTAETRLNQGSSPTGARLVQARAQATVELRRRRLQQQKELP